MELAPLQSRLAFTFADPQLLVTALTHRSFGTPNNERLEFIGDAVINLVIAHLLYQHFPAENEGDLSRARANLVSQPYLAQIAEALALGPLLRMSQGEQRSGGRGRASILADAFEAVIGAIYLQAGLDEAMRVIKALMHNAIERASVGQDAKDAKTRLQEWLQNKNTPPPTYTVATTSGSQHELVFEVLCTIPSLNLQVSGLGSSRKRAEQAAAQQALSSLPDC